MVEEEDTQHLMDALSQKLQRLNYEPAEFSSPGLKT